MKTKIKLILTLSLLWYSAGCSCPETGTLQNLNETLFPEYEAYVDADPNLTDAGKNIRKLRLKTLRKLINELNK